MNNHKLRELARQAGVMAGIEASMGEPKEPEQEPVAWMDAHQPWDLYKNKPNIEALPLYTEPPQHVLMAEHWKVKHDELQNRMETLFRCPRCWYSEVIPDRSWVGLTVEDKKEYVAQDFGGNRLDAMDWAEKRLKEKNA